MGVAEEMETREEVEKDVAAEVKPVKKLHIMIVRASRAVVTVGDSHDGMMVEADGYHLSAFGLNARANHDSRMRIKMSVCKHYRLYARAIVSKCQYTAAASRDFQGCSCSAAQLVFICLY